MQFKLLNLIFIFHTTAVTLTHNRKMKSFWTILQRLELVGGENVSSTKTKILVAGEIFTLFDIYQTG